MLPIEEKEPKRKTAIACSAAVSHSVYTRLKFGETGKPLWTVIEQSRARRAGGRNNRSCERLFQCRLRLVSGSLCRSGGGKLARGSQCGEDSLFSSESRRNPTGRAK